MKIKKKNKTKLFGELKNTISNLDPLSLSEDRKVLLKPLVHYIQNRVDFKKDIRLNFICTHNSRRSHLSQVWAQTMARYFGVRNVFCYSGGTEATALFPKVVETLENSGFEITKISQGDNPVYVIKFGESIHPVIGFSKTFDHALNPKSDFAAILTCSDADENCPVISGAETRVTITYEDPKAFDDTPQQAEKYHERSQQIATEMYYIFSSII